ncbi:hypothetical protein AZE42_06276 [Rhizopogon vesiculosus]|uniref:Uncharacterized protein n=1 Tax=Rhizopogon vesiculosus TaxID=180088 RepID=A0A1J8PIG8_9AGAM|nr:hypothetical protein AZE42_06276 [Rhizopogon vesiculosus]
MHKDSTHATAYDYCIVFKTEVLQLQFQTTCTARVTGYLIYAPVDKGRDNVAQDILKCYGNDELIELADYFMTICCRQYPCSCSELKSRMRYFEFSVRAAKGRTPAPSNHPSNPEFDNIQQMLGCLLGESP